MAAPVLTCLEFDTDGTTCLHESWVELPASPFPSLTVEEGTQIAVAIVGLWVVGLTFRWLRKALD